MYLSEYLEELNFYYIYLIAIQIGNMVFYVVRNCLEDIEEKRKVKINIIYIIWCLVLNSILGAIWSFLASYPLSKLAAYLFDVDEWRALRVLMVAFFTISSHYCDYKHD